MIHLIIMKKHWFVLTLVGVLVLWLLTLGLLFLDKEKGIGDTGKFGDMFGAVNALFSGLAFAGMIYAIRLQSLELSKTNEEMEIQNEMLKLQKDELSRTNDQMELQTESLKLQNQELIDTRSEFEQQNKTMSLQRFENTLFHLMGQHYKLIENLSYENNKDFFNESTRESLKGREVIRVLSNSLLNWHNGRYNHYSTIALDMLQEVTTSSPQKVDNLSKAHLAIQQSYSNVFKRDDSNVLSHYFRSIYHIFKFIFSLEKLDTKDKKFYTTIVVAQLSQEEQVLLFYNMQIVNLGFPKLMFLDKELDILSNLNKTRIIEYPWQLELFDNLKKQIPEDLNLDEKAEIEIVFDDKHLF